MKLRVQVFSCEFRKNTYFAKHLQAGASVPNRNYYCSIKVLFFSLWLFFKDTGAVIAVIGTCKIRLYYYIT